MIIIRFCSCGAILSTADVREGRPCKRCRERKKLNIPPLGRVVRKPNPSRNIWAEKQRLTINNED